MVCRIRIMIDDLVLWPVNRTTIHVLNRNVNVKLLIMLNLFLIFFCMPKFEMCM